MPRYHYKARDKEGNIIDGDKEAKDQYEIARALRSEGLMPLTVADVESVKAGLDLRKYIPKFFKKVSLEEKINFTRNIAVMIGAGVALSKSLEIMSRQAKSEKFKTAILGLSASIKQGKSFSDSLGEYPDIFPKFYRKMAEAGEKSGKLEESLKLVALQLKKDYAIKRKVRSAMIYPMIIVIAMIAIGILMMIEVVPTLVSTFTDMNIPLPAPTRFIIFVSRTILQSGLMLLVGTFIVIYSALRWFKSARGKRQLDWIIVHLPVIRKLNQKFNAARTCRTLSSLLSSGVDVLEALSITKDVVQNHLYQDVLEEARAKIQRGDNISKAFSDAENNNLFPPLVSAMISVGEETGELSGMLLRLAVFYENEVAIATKDLSTIIEPVLMIIIGIIVGFFAIAMISPIYNLVGNFT